MRGDGARDSQTDSASERIDDQSAEATMSQAWEQGGFAPANSSCAAGWNRMDVSGHSQRSRA